MLRKNVNETLTTVIRVDKKVCRESVRSKVYAEVCRLEWMINRELHVALKETVGSMVDDTSDKKQANFNDILTGGFKVLYVHVMKTKEIREKFEDSTTPQGV